MKNPLSSSSSSSSLFSSPQDRAFKTPTSSHSWRGVIRSPSIFPLAQPETKRQRKSPALEPSRARAQSDGRVYAFRRALIHLRNSFVSNEQYIPERSDKNDGSRKPRYARFKRKGRFSHTTTCERWIQSSSWIYRRWCAGGGAAAIGKTQSTYKSCLPSISRPSARIYTGLGIVPPFFFVVPLQLCTPFDWRTLAVGRLCICASVSIWLVQTLSFWNDWKKKLPRYLFSCINQAKKTIADRHSIKMIEIENEISQSQLQTFAELSRVVRSHPHLYTRPYMYIYPLPLRIKDSSSEAAINMDGA